LSGSEAGAPPGIERPGSPHPMLQPEPRNFFGICAENVIFFRHDSLLQRIICDIFFSCFGGR